MILEALLVAIGIAMVVTWNRSKTNVSGSRSTPGPNPGTAATPSKPLERVTRVLNVEGTEAFTGNKGFIKAFGLHPNQLLDLRVTRGAGAMSTLPERVRACLLKVNADGGSRGQEVAQLVAGTRQLRADEALYFALVRRTPKQDEVLAFVASA